MSKNYEQEQGELVGRIKVFKSELKKDSGQLHTDDAFL